MGIECEVGLRRKTYNVLTGSVLSVWTSVEAVLTNDGQKKGQHGKMQVRKVLFFLDFFLFFFHSIFNSLSFSLSLYLSLPTTDRRRDLEIKCSLSLFHYLFSLSVTLYLLTFSLFLSLSPPKAAKEGRTRQYAGLEFFSYLIFYSNKTIEFRYHYFYVEFTPKLLLNFAYYSM